LVEPHAAKQTESQTAYSSKINVKIIGYYRTLPAILISRNLLVGLSVLMCSSLPENNKKSDRKKLLKSVKNESQRDF
jgi:hypothetical protein